MIWKLRGRNVVVDQALALHTSRRLETALGRFDRRIDHITVELADENGPRGGVDTRCRMVAILRPGGQLVVEDLAANPFEAVSHAADRIRSRLLRWMGRRRTH